MGFLDERRVDMQSGGRIVYNPDTQSRQHQKIDITPLHQEAIDQN